MQNEQLQALRHSCAHLLAAAIEELYPDAKRTIGPAIETGFYYDFDFGDITISENDLLKIEKRMKKILQSWKEFERNEVSVEEARNEFAHNPYKIELIDEFSQEGQHLTIYQSGKFRDLCRGGHAENPSKELQHFKLLTLAGAYWRGDEKNKMLTRIYGTAFETAEELQSHLEMLEEAKKRDHRKLGKELDLFTFSPLVGSGLPLFTPRGTILREEITKFSNSLREARGYQKVWIPHITKKDLYETSGHWDKFGDELFLVTSQETSDQLVMKPMNCPHHQQIYASQPRSYRDLPLRYLETTTIYRDEKAGELIGLSRVRSITQDDSHVFMKPSDIEGEFDSILEYVAEFYAAIDMPLRIRLSFRDPAAPEKYHGDPSVWEHAQNILEEVAKRNGMEYFIAEGEAAFYGPKIDFMAIDALGREWQVATAQLDFVQPARFEISYKDTDGTDKTPIMAHVAIAGSLERFLSVYIEHTAGNFPLWIAPTQVVVIAVGETHREYCEQLAQEFKEHGLRVEVDAADESVGKKIRNAVKAKVPYMLVVGDKEMASEDLMVRKRGEEEATAIPQHEFIARAVRFIEEKSQSL